MKTKFSAYLSFYKDVKKISFNKAWFKGLFKVVEKYHQITYKKSFYNGELCTWFNKLEFFCFFFFPL